MAVRYLCPICDNELKGGRYCPVCKSFRLHPVKFEGGSLLNESFEEFLNANPDIELPADNNRFKGKYGPQGTGSSKKTGSSKSTGSSSKTSNTAGKGSTGTAGSSKTTGTSAKTASGSKYTYQQPGKGKYEEDHSDHVHDYGVPNQDPHRPKKKKNGCASVILWLIVIYVVIMILSSVSSSCMSSLTGSGSDDDYNANAADDDYYYEEDDDDNAIELTDEEVIEAGVPCNGYTHYDVSADEYIQTVTDLCLLEWDEGLEVTSEQVYSSNVVYVYGTSEYSYYVTEYLLDFDVSFDDVYFYVDIEADTATGEVMYVFVDIMADDPDCALEMISILYYALDTDQDYDEVKDGIEDLIYEAMDAEGSYIILDYGTSEVYMSYNGYDDGYDIYATFECLEEYDKYADIGDEV